MPGAEAQASRDRRRGILHLVWTGPTAEPGVSSRPALVPQALQQPAIGRDPRRRVEAGQGLVAVDDLQIEPGEVAQARLQQVEPAIAAEPARILDPRQLVVER